MSGSESTPSKEASKNATRVPEPENLSLMEYAYILGDSKNTATFLNFNGVRMLEGGLPTNMEQYEEALGKLSAVILSAPTLDNLGSTAALIEKNNGLPVLSHTGTLDKSVKCRSGAIFKRIRETAPKSIFEIPVFNPKYEPYIIHQSVEKGILSMYVLSGTRQEGEAIAKALSAEKEENVIKCGTESGMVAVLLWRPNVADKPVVRVLLAGTCSSLRIQDSLDKASSFLPFLNAPSVKSSDVFKKIPAPNVSRIVRNPNVARPTKPVVSAPRQPFASTGKITPPVSGSARASSKSSTASVKGEKPRMSENAPTSSRGSGSTKAQSSRTVARTVPVNAGSTQSRVTPGSPTVKRAHPKDQKQPIASKRPTATKPVVPVTKKASHPPSRAREIKTEPSDLTQQNTAPHVHGDTIILGDSTLKSHDQSSTITKPAVDESLSDIFPPIHVVRETKPLDSDENAATTKIKRTQVTEPAPEESTQKSDAIRDFAEVLVDNAFDQAASELNRKVEGEGNLGKDVEQFAENLSIKLVEEAVVKSSGILNQDVRDVFGMFLRETPSTGSDDSIGHHVLRMQTSRRHPPTHKPVKFTRPYYFELVKMPRDKNSTVAENIREFVSMIRGKYLVFPTDNVSELQLQAVINGHKSGRPCTVIPTHTSDILTDFLAKNESRLTDVHLSFETPLNKAGDTIEFDKRKIPFD